VGGCATSHAARSRWRATLTSALTRCPLSLASPADQRLSPTARADAPRPSLRPVPSHPLLTRAPAVRASQGWYSQEYDDAWPAPTLVYDATDVPSGSVFAWLIVPQSARGDCADAAAVTSVSASAVAVRATVGGVQHDVTVPIA
jgi:hypothetical protein